MSTSESDFVPYAVTTRLPPGPVLVMAPHPDDEVIGCGGAVLQHVRRGDDVTVVLATDGAAAQPHADDAHRADYKALRLAESRAAAEILGYSRLHCWEAPDRGLSAWAELDDRIRCVFDEVRPATVYAPSAYELHPDHHALAEALCRLAACLEDSVSFMFFEVGAPAPINLLLDITHDVERKRRALRCFGSQLALHDYVRHMEGLNVYRTYTLPQSVSAAEGYLSVTAAELAADPLRRFGRSRLTDQLHLTGHREARSV